MMGKSPSLLCMPLYRDDVVNTLMLLLLNRTVSGRIFRIR